MKYAGFGKRLLAAVVDAIILNVGLFVIGLVIGLILMAAGTTAAGIEDPDVQNGIDLIVKILSIFVTWLYFAMMEISARQGTLGKMVIGIKVTDLEGKKIGFRIATRRHFGKIISGIILLIGFFMIAFTQKKQGLHDMMAGCLVVNREP